MSVFKKTGRRCDTCGKFSMGNTTGEYIRKNGEQGYIWPVEDAPGKHICDDCILDLPSPEMLEFWDYSQRTNLTSKQLAELNRLRVRANDAEELRRAKQFARDR